MAAKRTIKKHYILFFITIFFTLSPVAGVADNHLPDEQIPVVLFKESTGYRLYNVSQSQVMEIKPDGNLTTPMGSLWKLFVYLYLVGEKIYPPPYQCKGHDIDEAFCCRKDHAVQMDRSLIQSCGLYFDINRLKIKQENWQPFWETKIKAFYPWLIKLSDLKPEANIRVSELLQVLSLINKHETIHQKTTSVLSQVTLNGTAKGAFRHLGTLANIKTFTWNDPDDAEKRVGGFAGWLNDGTAVWTMGSGTSKQFMDRWSKALQTVLVKRLFNTAKECVKVDFFTQYPIEKITELSTKQEAEPGLLNGKFRIDFSNGNQLVFKSNRQIRYHRIHNKKKLSGIFNINDYVARVMDREVAFDPPEAAKAFAIVIRTYLFQNGRKTSQCYRIDDSTRYQRVAINPPTEASRRLSYWTGNLVLHGASAVYYHGTQMSPNMLSWKFAKKMAASGLYYDEILNSVYQQHRIGKIETGKEFRCQRLPIIEKWLTAQSGLWDRDLTSINGYQKPNQVQVCKIDYGTAFSDLNQNKIYITDVRNYEDKIAMAHEYLHLCFKNHPLTMDEFFIERTARKLILSQMGTYESF